MRRGEIWWASLPGPDGSDRVSRRPVVVIQSDSFNESRINTVVVAAITSELKLAVAPGNVFVGQGVSTLPDDSVVNVSQVLTVDKRLLTENVCKLPEEVMHTIDDGMRLVLGL